MGDEWSDTWHWVEGHAIAQLSDGDTRTWTPQSTEARDFRSHISLRTQQGYYPPDGGHFVDDPLLYETIDEWTHSDDVWDHIVTKNFETHVPGGTLEWKVRYLPLNRVVPVDEAGDESQWCVTHLDYDDGHAFNEQVLCPEWGVNCGDHYDCKVENACNDCTPGPTGLCPEHLDAAIEEYGGDRMLQHRDFIIGHINHGTEPDENSAGHDTHDIHQFREYHPQVIEDPRGRECHDAKIELSGELALDMAAVISDIVFYHGYFTEEMKEEARATADLVIGENGELMEDLSIFSAESDGATQEAMRGEWAFKLLGANGFTHVIFEGMKARYDTHTASGIWHIVSDSVVAAATIAATVMPESWPVRVHQIVGAVRTLADTANMGIDLERNVEEFINKCRGDNCGDGHCSNVDYSYGCKADCESDYNYECNDCDNPPNNDVCNAYCFQCNHNNICEKGFGEEWDTCPSDCD